MKYRVYLTDGDGNFIIESKTDIFIEADEYEEAQRKYADMYPSKEYDQLHAAYKVAYVPDIHNFAVYPDYTEIPTFEITCTQMVASEDGVSYSEDDIPMSGEEFFAAIDKRYAEYFENLRSSNKPVRCTFEAYAYRLEEQK
jgi:hypothetical protein